MSSIKVTGLTKTLSKLDNIRDLSKVINTATKRTQRAAKTIASSSIREELALKKRYVDERISVYSKQATRNSRDSSITVVMKSRGILFNRFNHRINAKGQMRITIKPGQPKVINRVWMLKLRQGGTTPVYWKGKAPRGKNKYGQRPDHYWDSLARYGASPSQVLNTKRDSISEAIAERWGKEFKSSFNYHTRVK